jgi:putative glutamine amidotransferase
MSASSSRAPIIGLTGRRSTAAALGNTPYGFADAPIHVYFGEYADSIHRQGGLAVNLPPTGDARALVEVVDAVVITGGEDVDPRRYGQAPGLFTQYVDPVRDAMELDLVNTCIDRGIPVLGICRGLQVLNVARGGSLVQHLEIGEGESHASYAYPRAYAVHEVELDPTSIPGRIYGPRVRVNSFHHQAVAQPGRDVDIVGRAGDGVVEAIEVRGADAVGVQWHPEVFGLDPIFEWLIGAAKTVASTSISAITQEAMA